MLARFLPQTVPFFELLNAQNEITRKIARHLVDMMSNAQGIEEALKRINLLEEEADELNRRITCHLSQTFITPIDREDIHAVNLAQERVADGLQNLAGRLFARGAIVSRFPAQMMVHNLKGMTEDTALMLESLSKKQEVSGHLRALKARKSECEMLLAAGLGELHEEEIASFEAVREVILWSQQYDRLERTVDLVSDLADTLEEVVLKYV